MAQERDEVQQICSMARREFDRKGTSKVKLTGLCLPDLNLSNVDPGFGSLRLGRSNKYLPTYLPR